MTRVLLLFVIVALQPGCARIIRQLQLSPIAPRCADGLPPLALLDIACPPYGICGFSCEPGRWSLPA